MLRVDGVERVYPLSREYSAGFAEPVRKRLSIAKGIGGHYWVAGSVNGQTVQFLVDTGATSVALNDAHAKRLGIDYRVSGRPLQVNTASGVARGWRVMLDRVKVGDLEVLGPDADADGLADLAATAATPDLEGGRVEGVERHGEAVAVHGGDPSGLGLE